MKSWEEEERERESTQVAWSSAFIGIKGGGQGFLEFFIGEFKAQEENKSSLNGQLLKPAKISKTKEPQWGRWPSSSSGHVAGNVFIGMAILEASSVNILSQALAFQRRKNQSSEPTLHDSFLLVPSATLVGPVPGSLLSSKWG